MATPDLIIGLGHRKRVGKDTFAMFLEEDLKDRGYDVYRIAFAHDMKEMAEVLFRDYGLKCPQHYDDHPEDRERPLEIINKTPRQIWIEFGNIMRAFHPDYWVDIIHRFISVFRDDMYFRGSNPCAIIITDVRYPNEAAAIKSWGGTLVNIVRPSVPKTDDVADCALDGYRDWDHAITNVYPLEMFKESAQKLVQHLVKGIK